MAITAKDLVREIRLRAPADAEKLLYENFSILYDLLKNGASGTFKSADAVAQRVIVEAGIITRIATYT